MLYLKKFFLLPNKPTNKLNNQNYQINKIINNNVKWQSIINKNMCKLSFF